MLSCPLDADGERAGSMGQHGPRICGGYRACITQIAQHECVYQQTCKTSGGMAKHAPNACHMSNGRPSCSNVWREIGNVDQYFDKNINM